MCTETLLDLPTEDGYKLIMLDISDLGLANKGAFQKNQ